MTDLLGGRVALFFSTVAVARSNIQSGKIRALGVTTAKRTQALPNVPSIAEAGIPGYEVSGWYGMVAPVAVPKAAIATLHGAVQHALRLPEIKERLLGVGVEAVEMSSAQFGERINADAAKWKKIVPPLKIQME
jgi:tripartite-type tricarboxylate transporter receptor subunit TctC